MVTKREREIIKNRYGGRCAYCGCVLEKGWHIDHVIPVKRKYEWDYQKRKSVFSGFSNPEAHTITNMMPACASCNINKHEMTIEEFRRLVSGFINSLNRDSTQFKIAKRYGLIQETEKPVVFHFEHFAKKEYDANINGIDTHLRN